MVETYSLLKKSHIIAIVMILPLHHILIYELDCGYMATDSQMQ